MSQVQFVDNALALQSLRDSDFDVYSAYGEVIDNAIQADAKWIKISFDTKKSSSKRPYFLLNEVVFSDNGKGMDKETLHRCMQMGFSSRYNDRKGIGRFGVGMTLASINQCKRVDVYSRQDSGSWLHIYVDLDEIMNKTTDGILSPTTEALPGKYKGIASESSGTIVVWSKYDRQPLSADKIIEEMHIWSGRTYRYFIWDGFQIFLDGKEVKAIDPLYVRTDCTKFPDDPKAEELETIRFNWMVPSIDSSADAPDESPVTIRMSFLPKEFRMYPGAGGSEDSRARHIEMNEGVSIVRNKREVFYGHLPGAKPKFEEVDRWWGGEISFNAVLDRAFTVKNIKRGAVPNAELKEVIFAKINPSRKSIIKEVREFWQERANEEEQASRQDPLSTGHEIAENIAQQTKTGKTVIDKNKNASDEAKKLVQETMSSDHSEELLNAWAVKFASQDYTIVDDSWKGSDFFEANHLGGKDAIRYNMRHAFFIELNRIIADIDETTENNELYKELKTLIDLLIISFSRAESSFEADEEKKASDFIETFHWSWGEYLTRYLTTWKKERGEK